MECGFVQVSEVRFELVMYCNYLSMPIAPKCDATFDALKALHPQSMSPVDEPIDPIHVATVFTDDDVRKALNSFPPTSAAGLFGYRPSLMQQCVRAESFYFLSTLRRAVNLLASGEAPCSHFSRAVCLTKDATAVRPLCCGDPLRRLVAKCFCLGQTEISDVFRGKNFGVGCPGGVEVVAHSLRDVLSKHKNSPDLALLKIDFKNAFNLMDRNVSSVPLPSYFPGLERWTRWCYTQPPLDHSKLFESMRGVQQGDPHGALVFLLRLAESGGSYRCA